MIALAVRGIVRPSVIQCVDNIVRLYESTGASRVFLYSWESKLSEDLVAALVRKIIPVEHKLDPEPKPDEILAKCWGRCRTMGMHHWKPENPYKQIMQTQNVLAMVAENPWVVLSRPDLSVTPGRFPQWMQEETYTMPEQCRYPAINDQFAVGRKKVILKVWSMGDGSDMSALFEGAENPETALGRNIEAKKIKTAIIPAAFYRLDR